MVEILLKLSDMLREKNYRSALQLALQLHPQMPDNPYLLHLIAALYNALAHPAPLGEDGWVLEEESIRWQERAVQMAPNIAWLWAELGWYYELHLDHERAHQAFRQALKLDPCCIDALRGLASLWILPENEEARWITHEEAILYLKRIVELEYKDPVPAIHWLVNELKRIGRYKEAKAYALRALLNFHPPGPEMIGTFIEILSEDEN